VAQINVGPQTLIKFFYATRLSEQWHEHSTLSPTKTRLYQPGSNSSQKPVPRVIEESQIRNTNFSIDRQDKASFTRF
jgi:hypothetical protein